MLTKLLTVEECYTSEVGLHLLPGVLVSWLTTQPGLAKMIQGCSIELLRPDETVRDTTLVRSGVRVTRAEDGSFQVPGDENGPIWTMVFTLAPEVRPEDVPPGTEVWVLLPSDEPATAESDRPHETNGGRRD